MFVVYFLQTGTCAIRNHDGNFKRILQRCSEQLASRERTSNKDLGTTVHGGIVPKMNSLSEDQDRLAQKRSLELLIVGGFHFVLGIYLSGKLKGASEQTQAILFCVIKPIYRNNCRRNAEIRVRFFLYLFIKLCTKTPSILICSSKASNTFMGPAPQMLVWELFWFHIQPPCSWDKMSLQHLILTVTAQCVACVCSRRKEGPFKPI